MLVANPILTPLLSAWSGAPQLAVMDGGVRMPAIEAARKDVAEEEEARRAARPAESEISIKPMIPVYPRKQAAIRTSSLALLATALASVQAAAAERPAASGDNRGLAYVVVDKRETKVFLVDARGRLQGVPGAAGPRVGDDTVPGSAIAGLRRRGPRSGRRPLSASPKARASHRVPAPPRYPHLEDSRASPDR